MLHESAKRFAEILTEALYIIRLRESKSLQIIQDEIGHMLGRSGGRTLEYWRRGRLPGKRHDVEILTRELVRRGNFDAAWARTFVTLAGFEYSSELERQLYPQGPSPGSLPLANHSSLPRKPFRRLIGRNDARIQLMRVLEDNGGGWLVGIDGLGGIGKTALALEIAEQCAHQRRFQHIVWFQAAAPRGASAPDHHASFTFESILNGLAEQLGAPETATLALPQKVDRIQAILCDTAVLLIIDNLESAAQPQEAIIRRLRPLLNPSKALLTSRHRFTGDVYAFHLPGLDVAAAIEFIRQDALEKGINHLADVDPMQVTQLVHQAGGSPLALKLLVSQLAYLPLDLVLQHLRAVQPPAYLHEGSEYIALYRTVFFDSWALLREESQQLLMAMVNSDLATGAYLACLQTASELPPMSLFSSLEQLWRLSLLEVTDVENIRQIQYGLHPLTRCFVSSLILSQNETEFNVRETLPAHA
jgi:hypothetical protein